MRSRGSQLDELYSAAQLFRDRVLKADGSLFSEGAVWTSQAIDDLIERFVKSPDTTSDAFITKFERQLSGAPDNVIQLAGEALYVHILVAGNVGAPAKRKLVNTVLSWAKDPAAVPANLDAALEADLAHAGTAFNTLRPFQLGFLLTFVESWKRQPDSVREGALNDPWDFKRFLWSVPLAGGAYTQREALLHLVHPDSYEPIFLRRVKDEIADAFAELAPPGLQDVDERLLAIRQRLTEQYGVDFSFYDQPLAAVWRSAATSLATRHVKIAPGRNAEWWSDCLSGGYIAVGWDEMGDLRLFNSREAYRERFGELFPYGGNASQVTRKANELWTLIDLKPGDVVVANRGESEVLAVGTVLEPGYDWLPEREQAQHIVHVDWDTSKAKRIAPIGAWAQRTVMDLTPEQVKDIVVGRPLAALTSNDFDVLLRHQDSALWNSIPHADQTLLGLLRRKVLDYAEHLQRELEGLAPLTPFVSILNPNGRAPHDYWGCVFPSSVSNKSYAFQLFVIVGPQGVEFGFGAGSGESQVKDAQKTQELLAQFGEARERLASTKGASWWADLDQDLAKAGFAYRARWRDPGTGPLANAEEWLETATGPAGGGAAVSQFLPADAAIALGEDFASQLSSRLRPLVRVMDAVYGEEPIGESAEHHGLSLKDLALELCLDPAYLDDVRWLLEDRRQVIFYGPPGTGKTYVAEAFAEWFAGDANRVEVIQFHPSYAYEDFVEGIRPDLESEDLRYRLVKGLLRRFADRAKADPEHRYVLVIDEVNRANLSRVFGELVYLLEYRKRSVTLPYSQERFSLPGKLFIIGTMNTADRSIALVDFALRRRFHFVHFSADAEVLRTWLSRHRPGMEEVADLLAWVNAQLGGREFAIGFSYFMRKDLDAELLERIWSRSIIPALEEYYFSEPGRAQAFRLSEVHKQVTALSAIGLLEPSQAPANSPPAKSAGGTPDNSIEAPAGNGPAT